jgi:site-specific recombinase XerD
MIKVQYKHCIEDRGRWYVRKPGHKKIRIRVEPYDAEGRINPEFTKAYWAALERLDTPAPPKVPREKTFYWLVDQYYRSPKFTNYDPATQADKRGVLNRFCKTAGDLPYLAFRKSDVEASQSKRSETPAAADKLVKYLRTLFVWAIKNGYATHNPTAGVEKVHDSEGYHTWSEDEIAAYRNHHPVGTKARLALEIFLNIGARLADATKIGRQHEKDGRLRFTAHKGRNRNRTRRTIDVPIMPELANALLSTPTGDMTYLVNEWDQPFSIKRLGARMRDWCDAAGLHDCSAHGLRKAAAVALAENGATAPELCAIFGWTKLETAEIYIRAANARRMTTNAFARLEEYRNRKSVSLSGLRTGDETKEGNNRE